MIVGQWILLNNLRTLNYVRACQEESFRSLVTATITWCGRVCTKIANEWLSD